jgi:hypothetical protein
MSNPMTMQVKYEVPERIFRAAILNGVTPPATVVAQLEARGINVGDLENRIRQQFKAGF